jgi:hypothetical protein
MVLLNQVLLPGNSYGCAACSFACSSLWRGLDIFYVTICVYGSYVISGNFLDFFELLVTLLINFTWQSLTQLGLKRFVSDF